MPAGFFERSPLSRQRRFRDRVGLVERDDLRLVLKAVAIGFELAADGLVGLGDLALGAVDEMQDGAAAFGMAEESVAEADAFMRAFDQARQIGEDEIGARRCARRRAGAPAS